MIHATVQERYLELYIQGESIKQFHQLLCRALNTAPPEENEDWLELAGKLEELVNRNKGD